MNSRTESIPRRSSSHNFQRVSIVVFELLYPRDHHFIVPNVHEILFQWSWRRPSDHLAIQVVQPVVAGTPDLLSIRTVLHRAVQVGAGGGKSPPFAARGTDQKAWLASEFENPATVGPQVCYLPCHYLIRLRFGHRWRQNEANHRVQEGNDRSSESRS